MTINPEFIIARPEGNDTALFASIPSTITPDRIENSTDSAIEIVQPALDLIHPDTNNSVYIRPQDILSGRVEAGIHGKSVDVVIILNAAWIIGGGPLTQMTEVAEGVTNSKLPLAYIGPDLPGDPLEKLGVPSLERISDVTTVKQRYIAAEEAVYNGLKSLAKGNKKLNVGVLSVGYTAYGPHAVKEAVNKIRSEEDTDIQAVVINFDSAYPDTDNPSSQVDESGIPLDRFNPEAYVSTDEVIIYQTMLNPLPIDPDLQNNRAPKGALCLATSIPFTQQTVEKLYAIRNFDKIQARDGLATLLQGRIHENAITLLEDSDTIFIPLIASADYFDEEGVGSWITEEQYLDFLQGTDTVAEALLLLAQQTGRNVLTTGVESFSDYINLRNMPNVHNVTEYDKDAPVGVYMAKKPQLSRDEHIAYMKASDTSIHRTTQANAYTEAVMAGVPSYVITMPGKGYMDADTMDRYLRRFTSIYSDTNDASEKIAENLLAILQDKDGSLIMQQDNVTNSVYNDRGRNFFTVAEHLLGIEKNYGKEKDNIS